MRMRSIFAATAVVVATAALSSSVGAKAATPSLRWRSWAHSAISVMVPRGWSTAKVAGASWSEVRYVNPRNPGEEIDVGMNGCPGCDLTAAGTVTAASLQGAILNPSDFDVRRVGFYRQTSALIYTFRRWDSPYAGHGVIEGGWGRWTRNTGYVWVEVLLPAQDAGLARRVVHSLVFSPRLFDR